MKDLAICNNMIIKILPAMKKYRMLLRERTKWLESYLFPLSKENYSYSVYIHHFADYKWKQIVTIVPALIYLNHFHKKKIDLVTEKWPKNFYNFISKNAKKISIKDRQR